MSLSPSRHLWVWSWPLASVLGKLPNSLACGLVTFKRVISCHRPLAVLFTCPADTCAAVHLRAWLSAPVVQNINVLNMVVTDLLKKRKKRKLCGVSIFKSLLGHSHFSMTARFMWNVSEPPVFRTKLVYFKATEHSFVWSEHRIMATFPRKCGRLRDSE